MGIIIDAQIVYSKCIPTVITAPQCTKFLIDLAAPWCVCPTLHSSILFIIVLLIILWQSTMRAPFSKVTMIYMTTIIIQIATLLTMTAIICIIPVTAMSHPPFSKVLVPMEIQRSSNGLNGHKFYYNSSQDKIGFIPHNIDDIPVPPQFQIPSSCKLNMSTHELELMLFINKNFLSPSIFDKVMKWACSATAEGYKFDSPSYSTLKKTKSTTHSPILLMVVVV